MCGYPASATRLRTLRIARQRPTCHSRWVPRVFASVRARLPYRLVCNVLRCMCESNSLACPIRFDTAPESFFPLSRLHAVSLPRTFCFVHKTSTHEVQPRNFFVIRDGEPFLFSLQPYAMDFSSSTERLIISDILICSIVLILSFPKRVFGSYERIFHTADRNRPVFTSNI